MNLSSADRKGMRSDVIHSAFPLSWPLISFLLSHPLILDDSVGGIELRMLSSGRRVDAPNYWYPIRMLVFNPLIGSHNSI